MAFNPFLSMNEPTAPVGSAEVLNPFMISDAEPADFIGDNPFATSNPFSDFGSGYEPSVGDTVPTDIFGSQEPTGIGAKHFNTFSESVSSPLDIFGSGNTDTDRAIKPTDLDLGSTTAEQGYTNEEDNKERPLPTRPLPPETQNLILSVTGQMEFTSSHLLDRIPPTRTPSPVSVRDIHSPSPTPEPELEPHEELLADNFDINCNKPARPPPVQAPPGRPPPPRPLPPRPPAPAQVPPPPLQSDDINLFDAPAPVLIKPTKEAILSLYSAPKPEEKQIDFLSDDIVDDIPAEPARETPELFGADVMAASAPANSMPEELGIQHEPIQSAFPAPFDSVTEDAAIPMDCSEPQTGIISAANMSSSPVVDAACDDFRTIEVGEADRNPFENIEPEEMLTAYSDTTGNIFGVGIEPIQDVAMETCSNIFENDAFSSPQEKELETVGASPIFLSGKLDAFESNDTKLGIDEEDAFETRGASHFPGMSEGARPEAMVQDAFPESQDAFDAFSAKFESAAGNNMNSGAWGEEGATGAGAGAGFEADAFDSFLSLRAPPERAPSADSPDDSFSVVIRPKPESASGGVVPALAPPPAVTAAPDAALDSPRHNPFDKPAFQLPTDQPVDRREEEGSGPPTPLFDEDVSVPLEDFPRTKYDGPDWEMHLRQPNKKKITGQRFWKKVWVRVTYQGDSPVVQLRNAAGDREPFQELPLQACYSVSDVGAQQFDQFGKIFTVKLQYVFYKERPGVRPGQVTKAERITNKLSQFAAYAIQGDYQGVKEFGSDLRKLGLPVEHAPQVSQLFKLGSLSYEDVKQFSCCIEEALFRLPAHRDRALTYKMEEVQITAVDELYVEQDAEGSVLKQIARVRVFFLGFLSGMPDVELGVNDLRRQGREVVGRHDIIPVVTEEWIRVEQPEFHACVTPQDFTDTQIIKFKPPDACYIELMRFRVRPPKNRELPLQLKAVWCVTGNKVELRADVLVPGFASRALGQVPCEDVAVSFPIPDCWIYLFRVEKHFRYGSVKSAHRRTGKIKGIERFLGAVEPLQESLIEVTSGQAKYEHQHRAIVWRMPRLPKEGQGAYTTHNLVCRMALTSFDQVPAQLAPHARVEFTLPAAQVSHVTVRSVSLQHSDADPPEKYVRYLARHEYLVGIEQTTGQAAPAYALATAQREPAPPAAPAPPADAPALPQPPSSDSDSD